MNKNVSSLSNLLPYFYIQFCVQKYYGSRETEKNHYIVKIYINANYVAG